MRSYFMDIDIWEGKAYIHITVAEPCACETITQKITFQTISAPHCGSLVRNLTLVQTRHLFGIRMELVQPCLGETGQVSGRDLIGRSIYGITVSKKELNARSSAKERWAGRGLTTHTTHKLQRVELKGSFRKILKRQSFSLGGLKAST